MNREAIQATAKRFEMPSYNRIDIVAEKGEGAWIIDMDGTRYLDLYGGHAVALLGHAPPAVADAIARQARELLFYSNAVHVPSRAQATITLARIAPWIDSRVFFVNSGAEANETAVKIARKATGRDRVVSFSGSFHGRTLGALALCGVNDYRAMAAPWVDPSGMVRMLDWDADELTGIDETCAAVIVEPIQSMGGMRVLGRDRAHALRKRCDEVGAMLIFDEIQTAPARTGYWFAGERWEVAPDLATTAKAVAAGFPAGVVLARGDIGATVEPGDQGTTFGGGPLACAAIDAALAEMQRIEAPQRAREIEAFVRDRLNGHDVLGHGAMLGVRTSNPKSIAVLRLSHRVLAGGCPGDPTVLRLFPPVNIDWDDLATGIDAVREVVS